MLREKVFGFDSPATLPSALLRHTEGQLPFIFHFDSSHHRSFPALVTRLSAFPHTQFSFLSIDRGIGGILVFRVVVSYR